MRNIVFVLFLIIFSYAQSPKFSFVGLKNSKWNLYICENSHCKEINTEYEIRNYDIYGKKIVYLGSDENLRLIKDKKESVLISSKKDSFTQPYFYDNGEKIAVVKLKNKNSKKTEIISIDLKNRTISLLHFQHSTSLEPFIQNNNLIYSNVSCVNGCGHVIEEIWMKNLDTGYAKQLTLRNTISFQPFATKNEIYFSSLIDGKYQIFKYETKSNKTKRITFSNGNDLFPGVYDKGIIFIRERDGNSFIVKRENGKETILKIDSEIKKIRNLRIIR